MSISESNDLAVHARIAQWLSDTFGTGAPLRATSDPSRKKRSSNDKEDDGIAASTNGVSGLATQEIPQNALIAALDAVARTSPSSAETDNAAESAADSDGGST